MLLHADRCTLVVVDVQEKLIPAIVDASRTVAAVQWLLAAAQHCAVPVVLAEQYPEKLGSTLACLRAAAPQAPVFSKTAFSAAAVLAQPGLLQAPRPQVVLCGIEAHVCVLQTALELQADGTQVFVVADAVGARSAEDKALALARAQAAGVVLLSREMVLLEWLRDSQAPAFKAASRQLLQQPLALAFKDVLGTLPAVAHLAALELWRGDAVDAVIEHKPGQIGSLAVYHALYQQCGAITRAAASHGLWLYGEHTEDARRFPGKHPNIDRLLALQLSGGELGVRLVGA